MVVFVVNYVSLKPSDFWVLEVTIPLAWKLERFSRNGIEGP